MISRRERKRRQARGFGRPAAGSRCREQAIEAATNDDGNASNPAAPELRISEASDEHLLQGWRKALSWEDVPRLIGARRLDPHGRKTGSLDRPGTEKITTQPPHTRRQTESEKKLEHLGKRTGN